MRIHRKCLTGYTTKDWWLSWENDKTLWGNFEVVKHSIILKSRRNIGDDWKVVKVKIIIEEVEGGGNKKL